MAGVTIEQDSAYWEIHVQQDGIDDKQNVGSDNDKAAEEKGKVKVMFGVATKKDRNFYKSVEDGGENGLSFSG